MLSASPSPHIRAEDSIPKIMWNVNLALAPAVIFGIYHFGFPALITVLISILTAVVTEYGIQKWRDKPITISDGSAFLTGLLLAMSIPPQIPYYMTAFGSFVAIAIAKHTMGGLGQNIFNPALIGRAVMMASWPSAMTTWTINRMVQVDSLTSATPLNILKQYGYEHMISVFGSKEVLYQTLFLGTRNGSLGETSVILLLIGGVYLIYKKYINWQLPVTIMGTVGLLTWIFGGHAGLFSGDPVFHVMSGGLILGAFFMATDMVTTPITVLGQIIFAIGVGAITVLIRYTGGYPEGVCYSILIMNSLSPLIDSFVRPHRFGTKGCK